jgi:serine/threonine-protein kinase HipA
VNWTRVSRLTVYYEPEEGRRIRVGQLATKEGKILFEYAAEFLATRLELSPLKLPLRPGLMVGDPVVFAGLMGVFEDSLPDGWGRLLADRRAAKAGFSPKALGPLDRLAVVGRRAVGALVYEPEVELTTPSAVSLLKIAADMEAVLQNAGAPDLDRLIALGGSPQGARPKAFVQVADADGGVYGDPLSRAGCTAYLVKFPAPSDSLHAGTLEYVYMKMAAAAGIEVPPSTLLGRTSKHPGYFAVQRFDRQGVRRLHTHTLAGLLHAPHLYPSTTYRDLLLVTRRLTRDESAVTEQFRRACFNVFAHNRDDHTRNFAFIMDERGQWRVSPAYDLTFSAGPGGEHSLLVGREGADPTQKDLKELAHSADLKDPDVIIEEVRQAIEDFNQHAENAGLNSRLKKQIVKVLGVRRAP